LGVAKVARRSAFGKGGSSPADAFPRRFTDLSQAEQRLNASFLHLSTFVIFGSRVSEEP
jgi:hypothetical protein